MGFSRYFEIIICFIFAIVDFDQMKNTLLKQCCFPEGLLTTSESKRLTLNGQNYLIPIIWASSLINKASENGRIKSDLDKYILTRVCG